MPATYTFTTTVQDVIDSVSRDVRQQLSSSATPDTDILMDFTNRISSELLRYTKWQFLLSPPKRFVTQVGIQNYWIGTAFTGPTTSLETGLNLADLRIIKPDSVKDRSNFRLLKQVTDAPLTARFNFADDTSRLGRPANWQQDLADANTIVLYPAPDNQNNYQPVPECPIVSVVAGGALPARNYRVSVTYVDDLGNESTAPRPTDLFLRANRLLTVQAPAPPTQAGNAIQYGRFNVYVGTDTKSGEFDQDLSTLHLQPGGPFSAAFTEPPGGVTLTGPPPPTENAVEPISGYVIEFQYYKRRLPLNVLSATLQVPDDYFDVVVAGVTAKTFKYLTRPTEYADEMNRYRAGVQAMIKDVNLYLAQPDYINPDSVSIGWGSASIDTNDLGIYL